MTSSSSPYAEGSLWDIDEGSLRDSSDSQTDATHFRFVESPRVSVSADFSTREGGSRRVAYFLMKTMRMCDEKAMTVGTLVLQLLNTFILCISIKDNFLFDAVDTGKVAAIVLCALLQTLQVVLDVFSVAHLINKIHMVSLSCTWRYYMLMILSFSGKYLLAYVSSKNAFADGYSDAWKQQTMTMIEVIFTFIYFSTACQTGVGYGDIAPNSVFAMIVAVVQMGVGIAFSVFIISMTLSKFVDDSMPVAPTSTVESVLSRISHNDTVVWVRRRLRKYLLLSTVVWQIIAIVLLYFSAVDKSTSVESSSGKTATATLCFILQAIQCAVILSVSLKFARKTHEVTLTFLAQSFVSVLLSFAGIYATLYTLLKPAEDSVAQLPFEFNKSEPPVFVDMYFKLLYFSCVTMTTTGFGLIKPQHWAPQLVVVLQMLISTLYYIVIFGIGMSRYFKDEDPSNGKMDHLRHHSADFDDEGTSRLISSTKRDEIQDGSARPLTGGKAWSAKESSRGNPFRKRASSRDDGVTTRVGANEGSDTNGCSSNGGLVAL